MQMIIMNCELFSYIKFNGNGLNKIISLNVWLCEPAYDSACIYIQLKG